VPLVVENVVDPAGPDEGETTGATVLIGADSTPVKNFFQPLVVATQPLVIFFQPSVVATQALLAFFQPLAVATKISINYASRTRRIEPLA
jgi:sterol desaturase/sphingolipid hydroxylase (fatty acid hydroxylase superfamily)